MAMDFTTLGRAEVPLQYDTRCEGAVLVQSEGKSMGWDGEHRALPCAS